MNPHIQNETAGNRQLYKISGRWTVDYANQCLAAIEAIAASSNSDIVMQCGGLELIDITGAWILNRKINSLKQLGIAVSIEGFKKEHYRFIEHVNALHSRIQKALEEKPQPKWQERLNILFYKYCKAVVDSLAFLGWCLVVLGKTVIHPSKFRFSSLIKQCESAAVRASPIVGLISFLIAIVLAYQGGAQLKRFGAEIYSINLVTISVLREMGVLLTAIMLAGRSGSAFAAEIGTMKLNEEIDALETMGIQPMQVLVLPRILALAIMTPLLTFLADITGIIGSGVLTVATTNTNWQLYESRLTSAIRMNDFWIGISKAPVFGLLIGITGCYRGMQVANSAESVGKETTNAVVTSIFLVMLADALFSIIFTALGI